ncbi:hypothetical protein PAEPH01_0475 [Pancytospora epiphaga]|nr:hypothetical protein PAEPH01_0475 [Pancytospora epiphaga]
MLLCLLILLSGTYSLVDDVINSLSSKNIHILVARHPDYVLSEWLSGPKTTPFVIAKEGDEYSQRAKIRQNGDSVRIEINNKPLCTSWSSIISCKVGHLFTPEYHIYGYRFIRNGRCLSAPDRLTLEPCSSKRTDQEFVLVNKSKEYCIEDALVSVPKTALEQRRKESILKKAKKSKTFNNLLRKPTLEKEIEKFKPSPKTRNLMTKIWNKGWGKSKWDWPGLSMC